MTTVAAYTTATVGLQRDDRFLIAMPIVRESLPRNPSGKLTKHVLRAELGFTAVAGQND